MAFCTNCGAQVNGAFCVQCGTPLKTSGQAGAPPAGGAAAAPQASSYNAAGAAPGPRKTSPIVWILVALAGVFVLGVIGVVGAGFFVVHKAKQAGLDPDLMTRNPGMAMAKLVTTFNPDAEVLKTDEGAGTITVRDKKTGKVVTMTFDDIKKGGKFRFSAQDDDGKTATMEIGGSDAQLPSWVPSYPGATAKPQLTIKGNSNNEGEEAGSVTFTTSDAPSKVMDFYQTKVKDAGMKVNMTTTSGDGGMLVASDAENHRGLTIIISSSGSEGTGVNVSYTNKK